MHKLFIFVFTLFFVPQLFSQKIQSTSLKDETKRGFSFTFLAPINHLEKNEKRTTLSFKIPQDFKMIQDEFTPSLTEFIPKNEQPTKWSKILTSTLVIGKGYPSDVFLAEIIDNFQRSSSDNEILEMDTKDFSHYKMSEAGIFYTHPTSNRKEVVVIRIYSGPADAACIQYCMMLQEGETPDQALERGKKFLDETVTVIKG